MYFDSHAHLGDKKFDLDRDKMIQRAREKQVSLILNPGAEMSSSRNAVRLADTYPEVYAAVGIHPHDAKNMKDGDLKELEELSRHPKVKAIGEIGLDFHYDFSPRDIQRKCFKEQLELAKKLELPVIIHDREAHGEVFEILEEADIAETGCVMHCYSGSAEMAMEYVKRGIYISLAGPITFKNARKAREVAQQVPLEWLFIETDCPYLAPVPHRGKRNEPALVPFVAEAIAKEKGISVEEVAQQTMENAKNFFGIQE
ncbi:MAG: TatD family deoxyribonuclease [Tindallia sp. MSAO_Bac2]|nr:MAG: TatD family deoxyribonuclease [Tindallia sp. MSAO_Bac2]